MSRIRLDGYVCDGCGNKDQDGHVPCLVCGSTAVCPNFVGGNHPKGTPEWDQELEDMANELVCGVDDCEELVEDRGDRCEKHGGKAQ